MTFLLPFLFVLSFSFSGNAKAAVKPSFFIIKKMAQKHSDLKNLQISYRLTFFNGGEPLVPSFLERTKLIGAQKVQVSILNSEGKLLASRHRSLDSKRGDLPFLYSLFYEKSFSDLMSHFKALGLPVKTESELYQEKDSENPAHPFKQEKTLEMGFFEGKPLITLNGDGGRTMRPPQVWLDKNSLLPLRAMYQAQDSSDLLDVQVKGSYMVYLSSFFPRIIEVHRNQNLWCRLEAVGQAEALGGREQEPQRSEEISMSFKENFENYFKLVR